MSTSERATVSGIAGIVPGSTEPVLASDTPRPRSARDALRMLAREEGAATAEYAITIMAAVGFAGLLVVILKSGEVRGILTDLVHRALTVAG